MFERPHHQRIAQVLASLDAPLLLSHACLFGGGTAMALRFGEYRESVDIDFLVSDMSGYRQLRQLLTGPAGINAIVRNGAVPLVAREVRADQYGVRTSVHVLGQAIKFEVVLEGWFELQAPSPGDVVCGVACLTPVDMATSKLLANADRWADDGVFSRDLIDLAMMAPALDVLRTAVARAQQAYGASVLPDIAKALTALQQRPGRLERCMRAMEIRLPKAVLGQKLRAFGRRVDRVSVG